MPEKPDTPEEWPFFRFHWMGRDNDSVHVWIDMKLGRWWYVLLWRRGRRPYCYRSLDATPPHRGNGRIFFGNPYAD